MADNQNQPRVDDVVLGGQSPPPCEGVVLGGIEGVKRRLSVRAIATRVDALKEALNYGDAGLDLVIQALQDESKQVQRSAYQLLKHTQDPDIKQLLQNYKPWNLFERLDEYLGYKGMHAEQFANQQVVEFDSYASIIDPVGTAYALRYDYDEAKDVVDKLERLLQNPKAGEIEALVFGRWSEQMYDNSSSSLVNALVDAKQQLSSLKALLIGDIAYDEYEISWIVQSDISPILAAYSQLEILQVRGGDGLAFSSPLQHDNLEALIVETGGLSKTTVAEICALNLPALEHLELWFGSENYGGNCWIEDLTPILTEQKFPNLKYLGLRNSQFSDEIALAVVQSPLINSLQVLDLSMGTLSDEGAIALFNCPAVNQLDILNVSENFLSNEMIERLSGLEVQVMANEQKVEDDSYINSRYCSVAE